jgi:hypothetical protein
MTLAQDFEWSVQQAAAQKRARKLAYARLAASALLAVLAGFGFVAMNAASHMPEDGTDAAGMLWGTGFFDVLIFGPTAIALAIAGIARLVIRARPRSGWYIDPDDRRIMRQWNGRSWTDDSAPITSIGPTTDSG